MKSETLCPCCTGTAAFWTAATDNRKLTDNRFAYYSCTRCGLVFLDPLPANLERYYEGGYQPIPKSLAELRAIASKERYRLDPIIEKAGGDLLEIGPWIGAFSINAKDAGFNVDVIEMNKDAARFLHDQVCVSVTNTSDVLGVLLASEKCYDVITLWHSLEHLPAPWNVLKIASQRLKPNGILLVALPNIGSLQAQILRADWQHLDAPRHLYFWPPDALVRLLNNFGLTTVKVKTTDRLSALLSNNAWKYHISSKIGRFKYGQRIVAAIVAPVLSQFTQREGRGAGITATFRAPLEKQ